MAVNYRCDKLPKVKPGQDYRVPSGMNTLVDAWETQQNWMRVIRHYKPLPLGSVLVFSRYVFDKRDFIPFLIYEG